MEIEKVETVNTMVTSDPGAGGSPPPKTVNIFLGYFFMVNFCLGTGFLGVPYSFFYSGYLAAVPTLTLAAFVTWLSSTWLLEVMARAQVSICTEPVPNRHQYNLWEPKLVVTKLYTILIGN